MNRAKGAIALVAGLGLGALVVGVGLSMVGGTPEQQVRQQQRGASDDCGPGLTRAELDESLRLGSGFLLANQRPAGNFAYEWDWTKQQDAVGDNEVRQAGATWGLALILHDDPTRADVRDALLRSLDFWKTQAFQSQPAVPEEAVRRWVVYQGDRKGSTGTVALLALAHIELLRSGVELPAGRKAEVEEHLQQLLAMVRSQRAAGGGFHSYFMPDGSPFGDPNPYADGEALLALVKAANHLGRGDLLPDVVRFAREDQIRNVRDPRAKDPDPDTTKGYYQWVSMAWWELAHSEQAEAAPWGEWLMELAVWMIDEHHTLKRHRNTQQADK